MHRKKHARNASEQDASKRVVPRKQDKSVTYTDNVTVRADDSPVKRYAALKPWLDFANTAYPFISGPRDRMSPECLTAIREFLERTQDTPAFPARYLLRTLTAQPRTPNANPAGAAVVDLVSNVITIFDYCVARWVAGAEPIPVVLPHPSSIEGTIRSGRLSLEPFFDPFADFEWAIQGVEAERIGVCPLCHRFYFKVRKNSRACSRKCGTALRVREHRERQEQYEYNRKLKSAGVPAKEKKR